ncbi:MAG: VWA domain-containing protein [Acidobacteriota bacterium]
MRGRALTLLALTWLIGGFWPTGSVSAQQPATSEPFSATVDVARVSIDVIVVDDEGQPIIGLDRDDFVLEIEGEPIPIVAVDGPDSARAPLHMVIYTDLTHLQPGDLDDVTLALRQVLNHGLATDTRTMLVTASPRIEVVEPFTTLHGVVADALTTLPKPSTSGLLADGRRINATIRRTAAAGPELRDATQVPRTLLAQVEAFDEQSGLLIDAALGRLRTVVDAVAELDGRHALLYVGGRIPIDARANLYRAWRAAFGPSSPWSRSRQLDSDPEAAAATTAISQGRLAAKIGGVDTARTVDPVIAHTRDRGVQVHTLDAGALRRGVFDRHRDRGSEALLKRLAEETGGLAIVGSRSFTERVSGIARAIEASYTVVFAPPVLDGELHRVEIAVRDAPKGTEVRHRPRYRAPTSTEVERLARAQAEAPPAAPQTELVVPSIPTMIGEMNVSDLAQEPASGAAQTSTEATREPDATPPPAADPAPAAVIDADDVDLGDLIKLWRKHGDVERLPRAQLTAALDRLAREYRLALGHLARGNEAKADLALEALETSLGDELGAVALPITQAAQSQVTDSLPNTVLFPVALLHAQRAERYRRSGDTLLVAHSVERATALARRHATLGDDEARATADILALVARIDKLSARRGEAREIYELALGMWSNHPASLIGLATIEEKNGNYRRAHRLLGRLIEARPDHAEAALRRALNLIRDRRSAPGLLALHELTRNDKAPGWVVRLAYQELARHAIDRDRVDDAESILERARAAHPTDPTLALLMARVHELSGDWTAARELRELAMSADPPGDTNDRYRYNLWPRYDSDLARRAARGHAATLRPELLRALDD